MAKPKKPVVPPLSIIYRRIAISFVVLTVILVGIIIFFSVAKATVIVAPKQELKSAEFLVTAKAEASPPSSLQGIYEERIVEEEGQFETSGLTDKPGRAEGAITVTNTTAVPQTLVATTRLLSEAGVLFRLKDRVSVPGNGSTDAVVYADVAGPQGDLGPTRFTIPGLNSAKQKLIYGVSKEAMRGGSQKVRTVTAEDLERAKNELIERARAKLKEEFSKTPAAALGAITVSDEVLGVQNEAKVGEERQTLGVKINLKMTILAYDKEGLEKLAYEKVSAQLPPDRELIQFNREAMIVKVKNVNATTREIQLQVYADAEARLKAASPVLDSVKIAGMLPEEAVRYLESFDAIDSVEVRLFPSWQKRIPTIPDRIKIVIRK